MTNISGVKKTMAYRFRIYPSKEQEAAFRRISGCCRLVYNLALEQRRDHWRRYRAKVGRHISVVSQINELPELKREVTFLKEVPSHTLQQALKDLDRAYQNFFAGRADYPTPRKKRGGDSFRFPDPKQFQLTKGWLHAPKFGRTKTDHGAIRICRHRKIRGQIKTITIIRDGAHWYAAVSTAREVMDPPEIKSGPRIVGIDRGVTIPVALSTGEVFGAPTEGPGQRMRLAQLQRSVARKVKGSANRRRAIAKLAAFKARQARRRKDQLHKVSVQIVKNHDVIVLEDLKIENMTRSARGTIEEPGKQVAQKAGLNREILDRGWGMFGAMLTYKAGWVGKRVIKVAPHHSSQECSQCGHVAAENRASQATFACTACGHAENADLNAARVIRTRGIAILKAEGLSVSACGPSGVSPSVRQEETAGMPGGKDQTSSTSCQPAT